MTYRNLFAIICVACVLYVLWSFALGSWNGTTMNIPNIMAIVSKCVGVWAVLALFLFAALAVLNIVGTRRRQSLQPRVAGKIAQDL